MNVVLTRPQLQIVEIGAGSAEAISAFVSAKPDARAIAMELSPALLRTTRERGVSTLLAVAGNALQLPFRDRSVDAVVAFEVIEHLPDVARALDEVLRVLRRPGHIIIGLPNHASLWTPLEDAVRRRDRRAFGVERGRGAWRWWRRNASLTWRKRIARHAEFLYRQPILSAVQGGDADAVYYAAPIDLLRFVRHRGAELAMTGAEARLGALGRFVPLELQGSTVLAWLVER
jgi:SAM-dependent methyltransferase